MKNALHSGAGEHRGVLRAGRASATGATAPAARLERALSELAEVMQALAASRQEAQAAWEHIETLTEINSRLNRQLIKLTQTEAQIREFAYHDGLTGLPNRTLLSDRLKQADSGRGLETR